jgi:hypothetical protein
MCIYIYIYIYIMCMCTCVFCEHRVLCIHAYCGAGRKVCVYICIHACIYTKTRVLHTYMPCINIHRDIHANSASFHTHAHTYIHTHIHTNRAMDESQTQSRISSDMYVGQQCLCAEIFGGLVRGVKYWDQKDRDQALQRAAVILHHVIRQPETESVGIWSSCMKFCAYNRHPYRYVLL